MRLGFQKRIVGFFFQGQRNGLSLLCIYLCLNSILGPDYFILSIISFLIYFLLFFFAWDFLTRRNKYTFLILLLILLIHSGFVQIAWQKSKVAIMLENQEIDLHLFRKEQLFMTRDGKEQVIFQDKTGKRFAIYLSEDQRNTKEIIGN
ncbi:MAG TPA: hypothetical protein VFD28_01735, partial [Candidatus Eisenbacteria bacterium]|nr:hypothetical protein [Candidatus Eisenbacteria bacterium]